MSMLARTMLAASRRAPVAIRSFCAAGQAFLPEPEVTERVIDAVKNFEKVDATSVTATSHFVDDLGLDSLDAVEVVMAFEEEFVVEIPDAEAEKILSVSDAVKFICAHPMAK
jgi:NADH dehydrogenase (ubiquinone) 1 alpha/beta subcomplex 1